ncbi:MAG: ABC transporter permease [Albidovulum sp.]|nr:ABC transporter permease [Albidovulum sp.]MDE0532718.1 ABC transporter permease [Albidovulum sp.]
MARTLSFEKRPTPAWLASLTSTSVAILLALLASSVLLWIVGVDVVEAFHAMALGAFGDLDSIYGTCVKAIPLAFAGLATGIAFRAKIWNIGQEGQVFAGAMLGYWLSSSVDLPGIAFLPLLVVAGFVGGAALGGLAGVLKTRFRVDEIVSTVMMNYIIVFVLSYLLTSRLWMAPGEYYLQTAQIPETERIPTLLAGTKLTLAFPLAIAAVFAIHILLSRTTFGYELRAFGSNPDAARFKGTDPSRMSVIVLIISGGLAGLGGVSQTFGVDFRISQGFLLGLGSTGIIVGVIAGLRPLAIGVAAILFGGMAQGGLFMQVIADVSSAIVAAMQAIILIFFLCSSVLSRYRLVWKS